MQKIILICLILLITVFSYQLKYGSGGYADDKRIVNQIAMQLNLNESFINRNSLLEMKIEGLKGSVDAIEARARYELNLIKPGETLIVLPGNYTVKVPNKKK
ncbi:MAG: septum formation initiator family protein [Neisseriaceae bacterium]